MPTLPPPSFRTVLTPLGIGGLYFLAASFALILSRYEGGLAFIWIANAFLMAILLTSPKRTWLRASIAAALASVLSTSLFGMGPTAALPMAAINVAESLIVAWLCRRYRRPGDGLFGSIRPLAIFVLALCGVADIVTGFAAASVAALLSPAGFGASWGQWYIGHALGGLICTPILVMLMQGELSRWMREKPLAAKVEAAVLLLLFAAVTVHIFYFARYPMLFASLLPLVLIAFRVGDMGAAASIVILAAIGGAATLSGGGPLVMISPAMGERVQAFQFFLAFSFLMTMPVAAELNGRRRLFQVLRESEARFRTITEHSGDVVLNIDVGGIIRYASPSAFEQIGCAPDLLMGQFAANLVDPVDRAQVAAIHRRALIQIGQSHSVEFRPLIDSVDLQWCEMVVRAVLDERGASIGVISTIRDISRHKARQTALQQVAARDSLTGADTRRAFLDKLDAEMIRARNGARSSLLLIDIDFFKAVNDTYGHGAGDQVLTAFVERLRPGLRGVDSIGRLGGEEFAILLADSDIDRASLVCDRMRERLAEPIRLETGEGVTVTFSAGLVELDGHATRSSMLEAADKALYRAKHGGRNCLRLAA